METIKLQPRLALLADCVPDGSHLADIGTDHGYLPVFLLQTGRICRAIASDINAEPLEHARRTAQTYAVEKIDFRLCDGLNGIQPDEIDTIVIAGMGGETIIKILSQAPWTRSGSHLFILQPQTKIEMLRRFLSQHGYTLIQEHLVRDREKLYVVMLLRAGVQEEISEECCWSGVLLENDPLWEEYLDLQIKRLKRKAAGLLQSGRQEQAQHTFMLAEALINRKGERVNGKSIGNRA